MTWFIFITSLMAFGIPQENFSEVPVANMLSGNDIVSVYCIPAGSASIQEIQLTGPIPPEGSATLSFPWGFQSKVIFISAEGQTYFQPNYPASSDPDTIFISLAKKEFGGVFEVVQGANQLLIANNSSIEITSVQLFRDSLPGPNLLGSNSILPGELLRYWTDSTEPCTLLIQDSGGFYSELRSFTADPDSVYGIADEAFFWNGELRETGGPAAFNFVVATCIPGVEVVDIEVYDQAGYLDMYLEFTDNPLTMWDRIVLHSDYAPGFISCMDSFGRTYSLDQADAVTGYFNFDLLSLDFDFSFPEGR